MSLRRYLTVAALAGFNLTLPGLVQGAGPRDAHDCVGLDDDARRLACYDEALGRVRPSADATSSAGPVADTAAGGAATASATAAPSQPRREDFGLSDQEKRARAEQRAEPKPIESISAAVQSVSRRPTGEQLFVLDDGQVWMELEAYARTRVKPGDTVTIRRGALGSYMLVTPNRVATHVRRLK
jgi:hypothetical protein